MRTKDKPRVRGMVRSVGMLSIFCGIILCGCALTQEITHNRYVGDRSRMIYHKERCDLVRKINPMKVTAMPDNYCARYEGFTACEVCKPDK